MYRNLSPGAIGIHGLAIDDAIALARRMDFGGIDIDIRALKARADERGRDDCQRLFAQGGIRAGNWIMPNDWRKDDDAWRALIAELPALAQVSRAVGCTRASTYFGPYSEVRDYATNLRWHAERLRPLAAILAEHGIGFGMEFMGPRSLRVGRKHLFIHSVAGILELAALIGTGNTGLLLDAWHLYTSGDPLDVLDGLTAKDVVNVHVCDAPAGLTMDQYQDNDRRLPLETGVIDLPGFIRKLAGLGYDGPVTPEPFSKRLNEIAARDPAAAGAEIAGCMARLWELAGLGSG